MRGSRLETEEHEHLRNVQKGYSEGGKNRKAELQKESNVQKYGNVYLKG